MELITTFGYLHNFLTASPIAWLISCFTLYDKMIDMEKNNEVENERKGNVIAIGAREIGPYYWVGHCKNGIDYLAGQTFTAPANGKLKSIKLFASMVYGDTEASLSVFEFDRQARSWREKKVEVKTFVDKAMEGGWVEFNLPDVPVTNGACYGFKLSCNSGGMLAIAEAPWHTFNSYTGGEQWIGSSIEKEGNFHQDFDLAFEAEFIAGN